MDSIALPPDLEQLVADAIASGRFHNRNEIVRRGVEVLRCRETARAAFIALRQAAREELRRTGLFTIDEVAVEPDDIITEAECSQR